MIQVYAETSGQFLMIDTAICHTHRSFDGDAILDAYGSLSDEPGMEALSATASYIDKCQRIAVAAVPGHWRSIIQSTVYKMRVVR
jgi:hypothetical protein